MGKPTLSDLSAFITVATHRSFKRAADELGLVPSSLSHIVKSLESNLGVRLLNRTTRSVSLTEAGEHLLSRLTPALESVDNAVAETAAFRGRPSGLVRINAPELAARLLLKHVVPRVMERYGDVSIDLTVEGKFVDIVEAGFDAGVRLGESVPQDMVAVRFGGPTRFLPVASPAYLKRAGEPQSPDELKQHACLRHKLPSGKIYRRWEFERHGQELSVEVPGSITLNSVELMIEAALDGLGIAYVPEHAAREHLAANRLRPLLTQWCPEIPGLFLYYPGHRQIPPALAAFIEVLRETLP